METNRVITVNIRNNVDRKVVHVSSGSTLRDALNEAGFDYSFGQLSLDGSPLMAGDLDRTFDQIGIADQCFITSVAKADNA